MGSEVGVSNVGLRAPDGAVDEELGIRYENVDSGNVLGRKFGGYV